MGAKFVSSMRQIEITQGQVALIHDRTFRMYWRSANGVPHGIRAEKNVGPVGSAVPMHEASWNLHALGYHGAAARPFGQLSG
jgi:hypothetical protein